MISFFLLFYRDKFIFAQQKLNIEETFFHKVFFWTFITSYEMISMRKNFHE
jgi:hypothetical protein